MPFIEVRILHNNAAASCKFHLKTGIPLLVWQRDQQLLPRGTESWVSLPECSLISSADAETNPPHMQFISSLNPTEHPLEEEFSRQPDIKCHATA